jgi:hypothetical protein
MQVEEYTVDHFWAILWQIKTMLKKNLQLSLPLS